MRQKAVNFMRGRYGVDRFSNFLMGLACVFIILNIFVRSHILTVLGLAVLICVYVRMFSKKYAKRSAENTWYLNRTYGVRMWLLKVRDRMKVRKTHHIYCCPSCHQRVKIPKGRGRIAITCPKCGNEFRRGVSIGGKRAGR